MGRGKIIAVVGLLVFIGIAAVVWLQAPRDTVTDTDLSRETVVAQAERVADDAAVAEARVYMVDMSQSEVYWRIYRAGLMARLGHNHVISVGDMGGSVALADDPAAAEWELSIPVVSLVVDNPELRSRYGEDFSSVPSENDIAGTKRNMLSDGVLNGELFPVIRIRGKGFEGTLADAELPVEIELLGRTVATRLPGTVEIATDSITVSGEFRLTHTDLGMEPFTALGGAMSVGEDIDFTYRIHAVAANR